MKNQKLKLKKETIQQTIDRAISRIMKTKRSDNLPVRDDGRYDLYNINWLDAMDARAFDAKTEEFVIIYDHVVGKVLLEDQAVCSKDWTDDGHVTMTMKRQLLEAWHNSKRKYGVLNEMTLFISELHCLVYKLQKLYTLGNRTEGDCEPTEEELTLAQRNVQEYLAEMEHQERLKEKEPEETYTSA